MAEYNLFLGTARKSVGDVTLLRRAGRQVARVRLRHIANPKSDAQCETRNFLSPVIKFYGPLRDTLARSFEGYNKADSYNQFQRQNIALARKEGWFLTKGTPFFPMPYLLSQGQLSPMQYRLSWEPGDSQAIWDDSAGGGTLTTIGQLSNVLIGRGYKVGDIVTIILVTCDENSLYQPATRQFTINPLSADSINLLRVEGLGFAARDLGMAWFSSTLDVTAIAVIVARKQGGRWMRSTQRLAVAQPIIDNITSAQMKEDAIKSYGPYASSGGGGVYPGGDGEPFNVSTISGRALLFYGGQYNARTYNFDVQTQAGKGIQVMPANVEDYFYIKANSSTFLGTNAAGSLNPADWRRIEAGIAAANDTNTILLQEDTPFYRWLQSCGYTGA